MKPLLKEPVWNAVKGLWLSGLYGTCAGSLAGVVCGASVGIIVLLYLLLGSPFELVRSGLNTLLFLFFFALLYGGSIGGVVGAYVGFPSGIIGGGLGGRHGCGIGAAFSAFTVGSGILTILLRQGQDPDYDTIDLRIPLLILLTFTIISYAIGSYLYRLLDSELGFFPRWRYALQCCGIQGLPKNDRAMATIIAIAPVVLVYGYWLLSALQRYPQLIS